MRIGDVRKILHAAILTTECIKLFRKYRRLTLEYNMNFVNYLLKRCRRILAKWFMVIYVLMVCCL